MRQILNSQIYDEELGEMRGTGWLPALPDLRDYTRNNSSISTLSSPLCLSSSTTTAQLQKCVDNSKWVHRICEQGKLGSCTAHAAAAIVEYYENRAFEKPIEASRLFIYKTTRNLLGEIGDTGAFIKTAMASLTFFGAPPEVYWPYKTKLNQFDKEPPAFVYALADNYEALKYFCHDPFGLTDKQQVLTSIKTYLAAGIPSMFGFFVFPSYTKGNKPGYIPFPGNEEASGGHAVTAIGYDDGLVIKNMRTGEKTVGAIKFINSWGKQWGDGGYGWIPYQYILDEIASDFWSLLSMRWVSTNRFGLE